MSVPNTAETLAEQHGVSSRTIIRDGKRAEALAKANLETRTGGLLAMRRQELLRPLAKANQIANLKQGAESPVRAKLPKRDAIDTRREAAKEAGIGERTLDAVKLIKDAAEKGALRAR